MNAGTILMQYTKKLEIEALVKASAPDQLKQIFFIKTFHCQASNHLHSHN